MVEVGGLMDVVCQKSGERGGARRCPVDQYSHRECMTLHMHLMNQQFYLLITHRDAHLHIPHTALKPFLAVQIMGRAISHNKSANCGNITPFFFFYPLTLSPPLLPALLFVAGNSPRNTLCGVSVNVMHFLLLSPWPPILEEHRHSFCKMLYLKEKKQKKKSQEFSQRAG